MPAEMKARIAARQGKPGKQKQGPPYKGPITKEATMQGPPKVRRASRQMMHQMLELLLGMYLLYYELHWKYRTHYGDHLLFQRMYEKVQEELDGLAEKLIGYHGADQLELIELVDGANSYIKLWTVGNEDFIGQGLKAEEALQTLFHKNYDELKELDALPMGFDDYIMAVCNDHETHTYLLQQVRAGRGKEKTAMPSKKDILKALAIGGGGAALGAGGGYVAGHRTGMARDRETPYSGKHMQFAYVKGQQDLARRLRERMMQRGGKTKKAASRKALAGTALASLLAGGGAGYAGGRVHGKKIDEKTPYSGKHMQFAYTKGQHDLAQRLRAAVAARRQAGKTKKAADSTWWERQEAANRAMRDPKATGVRKLLADEELIGKRVKGGLAGLAKGGLGGAAGGAALGALLGRKGRKKALAKYLAQFGGAGGAVAGQLKGTMDVDKEWLKERGITTRMGGLDLELSPKAKKKYLRKKASVENLVEYAFNEELEAIAQG
jgi:DNA-binding ferritin-like protein